MWRWLRDKQGATLVLVAFLFVGLFGMLAVALDLSRLMVSRNQMQIAADAGALAAAITALRGDTLGGIDSAVAYALANQADTAAMSEESAVTFGVWDDSLLFEPRTDPLGSNAIRVRATQIEGNLVAWILGSGITSARASAIALFGAAVTETTCLRPLAIARETIDTDGDGVITRAERDVAVGRRIRLKLARDTADAPFFYYPVALPPYYDASEGAYATLSPGAMGGAALATNLATCNPALVGVRDSVLTEPGKNKGPIFSGVHALCGALEAVSVTVRPDSTLVTQWACNPTGAYSPDGLPGMPILAPLWDSRILPIGRTAVEVTDIGAFRITRVIERPSIIQLLGHFMRMVDGGKAEPGLGLVERPILVR